MVDKFEAMLFISEMAKRKKQQYKWEKYANKVHLKSFNTANSYFARLKYPIQNKI